MSGGLEDIPWAPIIALVTAAIGYGAANNRVGQAEKAIDRLETKHEAQIKEAQKAADDAKADLAAHRLHASENFVKKGDLGAMEARLTEKIDDVKEQFLSKVDEIKTDVSKKGIEHTIRNAVANALAPAQSAVVRERKP